MTANLDDGNGINKLRYKSAPNSFNVTITVLFIIVAVPKNEYVWVLFSFIIYSIEAIFSFLHSFFCPAQYFCALLNWSLACFTFIPNLVPN